MFSLLATVTQYLLGVLTVVGFCALLLVINWVVSKIQDRRWRRYDEKMALENDAAKGRRLEADAVLLKEKLKLSPDASKIDAYLALVGSLEHSVEEPPRHRSGRYGDSYYGIPVYAFDPRKRVEYLSRLKDYVSQVSTAIAAVEAAAVKLEAAKGVAPVSPSETFPVVEAKPAEVASA